MTSLSSLPSTLLAGVMYYGAFSRFTHGVYTPTMYNHQTSRAPDDGSTAAQLIPVMDTALSTLILFGGTKLKRAATAFAALAQGAAIVVFLNKGTSPKDLLVDFGVFGLASVAFLGTSRAGEEQGRS